MVLEENVPYHDVAKFVSHFLKRNAAVENDTAVSDRLLKEWKSQAMRNALRGVLKRNRAVRVKRISSRYLHFCAVERERVRAEYPAMNIKQVTCEMGRRWRQFLADPDPERLAAITEAYEIDRRRYYAEIDERRRRSSDRITPESCASSSVPSMIVVEA